MATALLSESDVSTASRWSIYTGLYLFGCGVVTAALLSDLLTLLADVIGLPAQYSAVVFAGPALLIGTVTWWAVVERRKSYAYHLGALSGFVTALLTGLVWTVRFVDYWGVEMLAIPVVSYLATFVIGIAALAGVVTGVPLMYARRRLDRTPME